MSGVFDRFTKARQIIAAISARRSYFQIGTETVRNRRSGSAAQARRLRSELLTPSFFYSAWRATAGWAATNKSRADSVLFIDLDQ